MEKEELIYFVQHGLALTDEQRAAYASRGAFQKILIDFFDGFDKLLDKIKKHKVNKRDQTEDASQEEENTYHPNEARLLNLAIDSIWNDYDLDGSNTIDADEAKQMIVDITGNKKVSKRDVRDFKKRPLRQPGKSRTVFWRKEELIYFVQHGLALTDEQRAAYASRGAFQKIDFFDGFDKLLDKNINVNKRSN